MGGVVYPTGRAGHWVGGALLVHVDVVYMKCRHTMSLCLSISRSQPVLGMMELCLPDRVDQAVSGWSITVLTSTQGLETFHHNRHRQ